MRIQSRQREEDPKHPGSYFIPKDSVPRVEMREMPFGEYKNYVNGREDDFIPANSERVVKTCRGDTLYIKK